MNSPPPAFAIAAAPASLRQELAKLAPALEGYPVEQMMKDFILAAGDDSPNAYVLLDRCLLNWIASLEGVIQASSQAEDEVMQRIQERRRDARDALTRVQSVLVADELVRRNRGQPC